MRPPNLQPTPKSSTKAIIRRRKCFYPGNRAKYILVSTCITTKADSVKATVGFQPQKPKGTNPLKKNFYISFLHPPTPFNICINAYYNELSVLWPDSSSSFFSCVSLCIHPTSLPWLLSIHRNIKCQSNFTITCL